MAFILVNGVVLAFLVLHVTGSVVVPETQVKTESVNEVINQVYPTLQNGSLLLARQAEALSWELPEQEFSDGAYHGDGADADEQLGQGTQLGVSNVNQAALEDLEDRAEAHQEHQEFLLKQRILEELQKPKQ